MVTAFRSIMTFEQSATLKTQPQTSGTISAADAAMQ